LPDGSVWVRTHPVTYLHDRTDARHRHDWHQLSYAVRGQLEVVTDDARRIVPADRAVWVPAGVEHVEVIRAPLSMRSLYVAPGASAIAPRACRTISVSPLLRELILHVSRIGALDRRDAEQARLVGVLFDLLGRAEDVPLELRSPKDPRARRFADLVAAEPEAAVADLARKAARACARSSGASSPRPAWRSARGAAECGYSTRCACSRAGHRSPRSRSRSATRARARSARRSRASSAARRQAGVE
jgi:hypothetical protein